MTTQQQHATGHADVQANMGSKGPGAGGNARTHGLTAAKCFSDAEKAMIEVRRAALESELHPEGTRQHDEVLAIAMASVRLERCLVEEQACRLRRAERAECYWDADMWAEVSKQAQGLPRRPELSASKLRQSLRGCIWLLKEWRELAGRVVGTPTGESPRPLDESGRRRAGDLLGLSAESRLGPTSLDVPGGAGSEAELAGHQQALIATQIAELEALTGEERVALDESIRIDTMNGINLTVDDPTRLVRRYESEARRVKERAYQNLKALQESAAALKKEAEKAARQKLNGTFEGVMRAMRVTSPSRSDTPAGPSGAQPGPQSPAPARTQTQAQAQAEPETPVVMAETAQVSPAEVSIEESEAVVEATQVVADPLAPPVLPVTAPRHLTRRARKELAARAARAAHRTPR